MLLIAKFRLKLKKVGETTRLLRYDLNQFPYYTVEVISKFKEVDLIDRVPEEIHKIVQEAVTKTIPKKKKCKKAKWLLRRLYKYLRKEEMARLNVDILGISELKWTGVGELYHYIR